MVFDFHPFWTWFLLFVRFSGVFMSMPGVGTDEVPLTFRVPLVLVIAAALTMSGTTTELPNSLAQGGLILGVEFLLGYLLGVIPALIIAGLSLAGHLSATSIGLNQASTIDPSLGEHITSLGRVQTLIGTALFLAIDGHHAVIRAAASISKDVGMGFFRPGEAVAEIFLQRIIESFELGIQIAAPIIVVSLIAQFILGLVTKFVPQVNVFIMSTPLTILVGLFVFGFTLPEMIRHVNKEYGAIQEVAEEILRL
jgi:flagellar biosynthetic protein FliR